MLENDIAKLLVVEFALFRITANQLELLRNCMLLDSYSGRVNISIVVVWTGMMNRHADATLKITANLFRFVELFLSEPGRF